jgi:hypothetical protein
LLQQSINNDPREFPRSELAADNPLDHLMKKAEVIRKAGSLYTALAKALLAATILLLDPNPVLRERQLFMAKIAAADETQNTVRDKTTPPARDPKIAVEEEYQMARRQGTVQALELFIARHGDDPVAEKARAELRRLLR